MLSALRVLPHGNILVLDTEFASQTGRRAYIGRQAVSAWTVEELPQDAPRHESSNEFLEPGQAPVPHVAFPATGRAVAVPNVPYYRKAVADGDLLPADAATARECGVAFHDTLKE